MTLWVKCDIKQALNWPSDWIMYKCTAKYEAFQASRRTAYSVSAEYPFFSYWKDCDPYNITQIYPFLPYKDITAFSSILSIQKFALSHHRPGPEPESCWPAMLLFPQ